MVAGVALTPAAPREPGKHQEYVEYTSGWMVAGTTEDDMPEMKLTDLQEGYKYQFRVKAVNRAGASYPSESTDEITAKTRKQKPIIDRSMMPKEVGTRLDLCSIQCHLVDNTNCKQCFCRCLWQRVRTLP